MNRVILMGRIATEPTPRTTPSNNHVLSFTLAVQRRFAQEGQQQADFINCIAWNKTADFINKWFTKGSMIAIEGRLQSRTWEENGAKRYATEVVVENAYFTGEKREQGYTSPQEQAAERDFLELGVVDDESDLPF